jgi:glycerol kinase
MTDNSPLILSIDQGTTSSRVILFDQEFNIRHVEQRTVELFYPQNGWVEQDATTIWHDVRDMVLSCLKLYPNCIRSIGITNQRETVILWDKHTGKPIAPAIVWQDRRTAHECQNLKSKGHEPSITQKTGLLLDPYFSASKIAWVLKQNLDLNTDNILVGTIDTWLIWNLTGGQSHVTDATNASRTMLFNIHENKWDEELLSLFDIPRVILPRTLNCVDDFGTLSNDIFSEPVPIRGVAGDQQAALIGQCCFDAGMMKSTYGTGCFALLNTGNIAAVSKNKLLTTIAYRFDDITTYATEGSIFVAGAAIQFLRDQFHFFDHATITNDMATSVPDNHGVYFVPALTGIGAPYWDAEARGAVFGLTRDTTINHLVRAALEAQAYQTHDLLTAMAHDTGQHTISLRVDGGLVANEFMCQFLADILNITIDVPEVIESTALGAAILAHKGLYGTSLHDLSKLRKTAKTFMPKMNHDTRQKYLNEWNLYIQKLLYAPPV